MLWFIVIHTPLGYGFFRKLSDPPNATQTSSATVDITAPEPAPHNAPQSAKPAKFDWYKFAFGPREVKKSPNLPPSLGSKQSSFAIAAMKAHKARASGITPSSAKPKENTPVEDPAPVLTTKGANEPSLLVEASALSPQETGETTPPAAPADAVADRVKILVPASKTVLQPPVLFDVRTQRVESASVPATTGETADTDPAPAPAEEPILPAPVEDAAGTAQTEDQMEGLVLVENVHPAGDDILRSPALKTGSWTFWRVRRSNKRGVAMTPPAGSSLVISRVRKRSRPYDKHARAQRRPLRVGVSDAAGVLPAPSADIAMADENENTGDAISSDVGAVLPAANSYAGTTPQPTTLLPVHGKGELFSLVSAIGGKRKRLDDDNDLYDAEPMIKQRSSSGGDATMADSDDNDPAELPQPAEEEEIEHTSKKTNLDPEKDSNPLKKLDTEAAKGEMIDWLKDSYVKLARVTHMTQHAGDYLTMVEQRLLQMRDYGMNGGERWDASKVEKNFITAWQRCAGRLEPRLRSMKLQYKSEKAGEVLNLLMEIDRACTNFLYGR